MLWGPSRHLGSSTAANWVSFDLNVSCSSCWGYSLINTLKIKNKNLKGYSKNSLINTLELEKTMLPSVVGTTAKMIGKDQRVSNSCRSSRLAVQPRPSDRGISSSFRTCCQLVALLDLPKPSPLREYTEVEAHKCHLRRFLLQLVLR